ncbi:MAG: glycosyltransferase family protein, partial [Planctomycetaceae bacterium]
SDAEPWSHQVAAMLQIPRISFDHFGLLVHCRPALSSTDRLLAIAQTWCYRRLMGTPDRALVSSFYRTPVITPGVRLTGTLLRTAVRAARPADDGHLMVYFNQGLQQCDATDDAA